MALIQITFLNAASNDAEKKNDSIIDNRNNNSSDKFIANSSPNSSSNSYIPSSLSPISKTTDKPVTSLKDLDLRNSFSINQIRNPEILSKSFLPEQKNENIEIPQESPEISQDPVKIDFLKELVKQFAANKLTQGFKQIELILTTHPVRLTEGVKVEISIENDAQKEIFDEFRQEFLDFLRRELNNSKIQLEISEIKIENSKLKAYTPSEKFEILRQKNPLILELKKKLDLDINY